MTDLPISGMLDVAVDQASLRQAHDEIQEGMGQLSIGVDASGGQTSTRNVEGREQAMARALATEANDIAEEQAEWLELIYFELADEGSGDLFDTGEAGGFFSGLFDTGTDAAPGAALVGAAGALTGSAKALGAAAAVLGGSSILDFLTGNELPFGNNDDTDFGDLEDRDLGLDVEEPEWMPIGVDEPGPLSIDDPSPLGVEDPGLLPVDPDYYAPLDPDYAAPIDDARIPVDLIVDVNVSGGDQSVSDDGGGSGRLQLFREEEWPVVGPTFERVNNAGEDFFSSTPLGVLPSRRDSSQSGAESVAAPQQTTSVTNNVNTDVEVTADGERWKRELRREYERQIEEIERRLRNVERKFDRV